MKTSAVLFVIALAGCELPVAMNDAGPVADDAAALANDGALGTLDAEGDAGAPTSDSGIDASVTASDAAIDANAHDDAGPRTDFARPTGSHEVCIGVACYVEPPSGNWGFADVVAVGHDAFWIAGARGLAFAEGGVYTYLDPIAPHPLHAIDGSPRDLWAVGDAGTALHFDGEVWTRVATGVSSDLLDVTVTDDGRAFAVGTGATALELVSGAWRTIPLGLSGAPTLRAVSESGGELWIAGSDRTVLHRVAGVVTALDRTALLCARSYSGENIDYLAVYAAGPHDVFVSGHSNQTSATDRRDVMVRAIDGAITCSDRPSFRSLDGIGASDIWGATSNLLDVFSHDADQLAHWDGFDWTTQLVPARGHIACAGAHRAVAIVGDDDAHIVVTDGATVTAVGEDYHRIIDGLHALQVSPTGVAYFALGADWSTAVLTRRALDGSWASIATNAEARIVDGEQAWWFDASTHVGTVDGTGHVTTYTLASGLGDLAPLSSTTAAVVDGARNTAGRLSAGTVTPLADTRQIENVFAVGPRTLATLTQDILSPFHVDDPSVWQLAAAAWTATTLARCAGVSMISRFDGDAWSWSDTCARHFHADGTVTTQTFTSMGNVRDAAGLAGSEDAYAVVDFTLHRLHAGTWSTLSLAGASATISVAVDRQYVWFASQYEILRARHDAL